MRRISALLLLALFTLSPLTALLNRASELQLPPCCRGEGKHRCSMAAHRASTATGPAFSTSGACPLFPHPVAAQVTPLAFHLCPRPCSALRPPFLSSLIARPAASSVPAFHGHADFERGPPSSPLA